ncbi:MAG: pantetheine-phosphate adenylyltransferase [Opitutales bacterium]|nr:pantetheine-phosphate adenylyltransferase [Opitutales bacterium]
MKKALYPGTFDPVTFGHLDVLTRGSHIFDEVIMAVAESHNKAPMFSLDKRLEMIHENVGHLDNVTVMPFEGLIVDFALKMGASALIRGLRAVSDFEYEFQMAQMNRLLEDKVETIFLMPNEKYFFTSSNLVKQVHTYTDRDTRLVPPNVYEELKKHTQKVQ